MPELPEVETTARAIAPLLVGQAIQNIQAFTPKLRYPIPPFSGLEGQIVSAVTRRAKYLLIALEGAETLVIHLGMSGRLMTSKPDTHGHFIIENQTHSVWLKDPRRFGLVLRLKTAEIQNHPLFKDLGPEPLTEEFTAKVLHNSLKNLKTAIKPTLMNPKVVVGVGNIYASESLFLARINPQRPANKVTLKDCEVLVPAIKSTLLKAIKTGGSSLRDFAHPSGILGNYQNNFNVYDKTGKPCSVCGTQIRQITQSQRSSWFCPTCQPK